MTGKKDVWPSLLDLDKLPTIDGWMNERDLTEMDGPGLWG